MTNKTETFLQWIYGGLVLLALLYVVGVVGGVEQGSIGFVSGCIQLTAGLLAFAALVFLPNMHNDGYGSDGDIDGDIDDGIGKGNARANKGNTRINKDK